jgi:hypothetical protein
MGRTIARLRRDAAVEGLIAMLLGRIADGYTGAIDLPSMLVKHSMRTVQYIGVPRADEMVMDADAVVAAPKSRTVPARQAVSESLAALAWLRAAGCWPVFFKYCSTFDSTDARNIGLVADALLAALGVGFALACPAFPLNARSVYKGYLFVGGMLPNESGLENNPRTPMRDANLVRVLSRQTNGTAGLVPYAVVEQGGAEIRSAMSALAEQGWRYAIVDAVNDVHLVAVGEAAAAHALITGGSGVAMALPANFRRSDLLLERADPGGLPTLAGAAAMLAGSCSHATLGQLDFARARVGVRSRPTCGPRRGGTCGRRNRLGVPATWRDTNRDRRFGTDRKDCDGAAATRPGCGRRADRGRDGAHWRGLGVARCAAPCRGRRRNLGGRGVIPARVISDSRRGRWSSGGFSNRLAVDSLHASQHA